MSGQHQRSWYSNHWGKSGFGMEYLYITDSDVTVVVYFELEATRFFSSNEKVCPSTINILGICGTDSLISNGKLFACLTTETYDSYTMRPEALLVSPLLSIYRLSNRPNAGCSNFISYRSIQIPKAHFGGAPQVYKTCLYLNSFMPSSR